MAPAAVIGPVNRRRRRRPRDAIDIYVYRTLEMRSTKVVSCVTICDGGRGDAGRTKAGYAMSGVTTPSGFAADDERRVRSRVRVGTREAPAGLLRGGIALTLVGTLVIAIFHTPPKGATAMIASLQTLTIAVIAFYFGSRSRKSIASRTRDVPITATAKPSDATAAPPQLDEEGTATGGTSEEG